MYDAKYQLKEIILWGHQPLARKINGSWYYYIYNARGDVVDLVNNAGIVVKTYEDTPWGEIRSETETVGMAIGAGMYFIGIATTIVIILAQMILHAKLNLFGALNEEYITFVIENTNDVVTSIITLIRDNMIKVDDMVYIPIDNNIIEISLSVSGDNIIFSDELIKAVNQNLNIKSVKLSSETKV